MRVHYRPTNSVYERLAGRSITPPQSDNTITVEPSGVRTERNSILVRVSAIADDTAGRTATR